MAEQYAGNSAIFPIDYTVPDDGDASSAASVSVGLEALGDRTAWLKERRIHRIYQLPLFTENAVLFFFEGTDWYESNLALTFTQPSIMVTNVQVGDTLLVDVCGMYRQAADGATGTSRMRLKFIEDNDGAQIVSVPNNARIRIPGKVSGGLDLEGCFSIMYRHIVGVAGDTRISIQGHSGPDPGDRLNVVEAFTMRVVQVRGALNV